ncbi:hypothetical protein NQ318_014145 [Aromia moschata]|uniref:DUF4097 domain-containing protein n=1 Tax=Aromia moschata TaxID=1265417 RepID=A0AAV8X7S4_9CUCU|nr:hypothetical protein NQ318_014145 [Aromia moschata]
MFEYSEPVNTVTDMLTATAAYYLNASYYQYMLNLHKYKVMNVVYVFEAFHSRLLTLCSNTNKYLPAISLFRNYATIVKKELEVPTFCDVYINLPYHHDINGNRVEIFTGKVQDLDNISDNIFCSVKAPIKANLNIKSKKDIIIGYFNGDKLHLKSSEGNIIVDKFQGNSVKLKTRKGNINLKDYIQASTIIAEVLENGSIISGRLQGLTLKLKTKYGNISVESSYSYESLFEVDCGNFDLHNIHKSCEVLLKEGDINIGKYYYLTDEQLNGFDGDLKALVEKGSANIQLSRITKDSEINMLNGTLNLKLGDACQDYVQFKIQAKGCDISDNIKSTVQTVDKGVVLTPDINNESTVLVNCVNGTVNVESASWQDMIKSKLKKRHELLKYVDVIF